LANTSARLLLELVQRGKPWNSELIDAAAEDPNLFRDLVEPLSDAFDTRMTAAYVSLFSQILERLHPALRAAETSRRFERIGKPRRFSGPDPGQVVVLSRVTLGADVAITSTVMAALLKRFPASRITFAGPRKCWELFAAEPRIELLDVPYQRATSLGEKLDLGLAISVAQDTIVVDPDSRITQLGLLPICPEDRYYFFDSRSDSRPGSLSQLASSWAQETFGVSGAPWISTQGQSAGTVDITVSLGVGGNEAKRIGGPFERELMERLAASGKRILVDKGAGGEEAERVDRAVEGLPNVSTFQGDFARFARSIARSSLYVGYDSAGQHVAGAAGVPHSISIFAGYPNERFVERWHPAGSGAIAVIRAKGRDPRSVLADVRATGGVVRRRPLIGDRSSDENES
jgi:ADP-heptose:LPS heptosyltransferase